MEDMKLAPAGAVHEQKATARVTEESPLNKEITIPLLLKYGLPTILTLVVFSTFGIVDQIFATRAIGTEAMASITAFMPVFQFISAIGVLFSAGGAAIIVKKIGMGRKQEARQNFSLISIIALFISLLVTLVAVVFPGYLLDMLGVNYEIYEIASSYLRIAAWSFPFIAMGQIFNQFLIADGKPILSMCLGVIGSAFGAGLNAVFLFALDWGIEGLAWATIIGTVMPTIAQLFVFANNKTGVLYFTKPGIDGKSLGAIAFIGMSGFLPTMASAAIVLVMNNVVVRTVGMGAMGIAIAGMVMSIVGVFAVVFNGYGQGVGALISYNYGKGNHDRQKKLFRYNIRIMIALSLIVLVVINIFANLLLQIYLPYGVEMHTMGVRGLRIMSLSFILIGINGLAGIQFMALGKGAIAVTTAMVATVGINIPLLVILPRFHDLTGVWLAAPISQGIMIFISVALLLIFGKKYNFR